MLYLLLGIVFGWSFWELCERYADRELIWINPLVFVTMLIWGSSGFFVLRFFSESFFSPILQFFYMAVPDWDIPIYSWTSWDFFTHRSFLFSSNILPIAYIGISYLWSSFGRQRSTTIGLKSNSLPLSIAVGLSVGISAHLLADVLQNLILYGKDLILFLLDPILPKHYPHYPYRSFKFEIGNMRLFMSLAWVGFNLVLGFAVPFYTIKSAYNQREI